MALSRLPKDQYAPQSYLRQLAKMAEISADEYLLFVG